MARWKALDELYNIHQQRGGVLDGRADACVGGLDPGFLDHPSFCVTTDTCIRVTDTMGAGRVPTLVRPPRALRARRGVNGEYRGESGI